MITGLGQVLGSVQNLTLQEMPVMQVRPPGVCVTPIPKGIVGSFFKHKTVTKAKKPSKSLFRPVQNSISKM